MKNNRLQRTVVLSSLVTFLVVVGALMAWRAYAMPTVPQGIAYSGELLSNGTPDNAMHNFTFALFDGGGGNPLCTDGPRNVTVAGGRFDIANLFGANCPLDMILAAKTSLQLQITVDNNILMPLQPFGTVPFAARARVAETAETATTASTLEQTPTALGSAGSVGDIVASLLTPQQFDAQRGPGWVLCDGKALMGTALGRLSGAANLPDLRGQFLRGFNAGRNDGRGDGDGDAHVLGSSQVDQFGAHVHHLIGSAITAQQGGPPAYVPAGGGPQLPDTASAGGNETRPKNVAVNFFCRVN